MFYPRRNEYIYIYIYIAVYSEQQYSKTRAHTSLDGSLVVGKHESVKTLVELLLQLCKKNS